MRGRGGLGHGFLCPTVFTFFLSSCFIAANGGFESPNTGTMLFTLTPNMKWFMVSSLLIPLHPHATTVQHYATLYCNVLPSSAPVEKNCGRRARQCRLLKLELDERASCLFCACCGMGDHSFEFFPEPPKYLCILNFEP